MAENKLAFAGEPAYTGKVLMKITVSIVEDDSQTREILLEWIRGSEGFQGGGGHGSGEAALAHLPEERPNIALVDIGLPRMTGIECVRQLKTLLPETQFVMLTVYQDSHHIFMALAAGASGYLLKHTPQDELLAALRQVQAGGSPMSCNIARKVVQAFQQPGACSPEMEALSPRQWEVLELLARGHLCKEIAESLGMSVFTVNTYLRRIYEKLHVHSRSQAMAKYTRLASMRRTQEV
jgi:DNA-binding NarL/FixJ family response regulator